MKTGGNLMLRVVFYSSMDILLLCRVDSWHKIVWCKACVSMCSRTRTRGGKERKPLKKSKQWILDKKERGRRQGK